MWGHDLWLFHCVWSCSRVSLNERANKKRKGEGERKAHSTVKKNMQKQDGRTRTEELDPRSKMDDEKVKNVEGGLFLVSLSLSFNSSFFIHFLLLLETSRKIANSKQKQSRKITQGK